MTTGEVGKRRRLLIKALNGGPEPTQLERGAILEDMLRAALVTAGVTAELVRPGEEADVRILVDGEHDETNGPFFFIAGSPRYEIQVTRRQPRLETRLFPVGSHNFDRAVAEALSWALV